MMHSSLCAYLLLLIRLSVSLASATESSPYFIVTTPNRYIPGRSHKVCFHLEHLPLNPFDDEVVIDLKLSELWLSSQHKPIPDGVTNRTVLESQFSWTPLMARYSLNCTKLEIPGDIIDKNRARDANFLLLEINGAANTFNFTDTMKLTILGRESKTEFIFIQTDRPLYTSGKKVNIRILALNTELKASTTQIDSIVITSPEGEEVQSWADVEMQQGMKQLSVTLSDKPELGFYTITTIKDGKQTKKTFEVIRTNWSKFDVTINVPEKEITYETDSVTVNICARYPFGQPVQGSAEVTICINQQTPDYDSAYDYSAHPSYSGIEDRCATLMKVELEDGCAQEVVPHFTLDWGQFGKADSFQLGGYLAVYANVTEKGSGSVEKSNEAIVHFSKPLDLVIKMEGSSVYRPGLPYNGLIKLTKEDGTPVPNEEIMIFIDKWDIYGNYSKTYTTNDDGLVKFSLPPITHDIIKFTIQALVVNYEVSFFNMRQLLSFLYVEGFHSEGGSFLQLQPPAEVFSCGSQARFTAQYLLKDDAPLDVVGYQVVGNSDLVTAGLVKPNMEMDFMAVWDEAETGPCFYNWYECRSAGANSDNGNETLNAAETNSTEIDELTEILESIGVELVSLNGTDDSNSTSTSPSEEKQSGYFTIAVDITPEMSPKSKIVVYFITSSGEVVIDSIPFSVEQCGGRAKMEFSKNRTVPGEAVDIKLNAAPGAICGYSAIDSNLAARDQKLTLKNVFSQITDVSLEGWTGYMESQNELDKRCDQRYGFTPETRHEAGFVWRVPFHDISTSMKESGLAYSSDVIRSTTPCITWTFDDIANATTEEVMSMMDGSSDDFDIDYENLNPDNVKIRQEVITSKASQLFSDTWLFDLVVMNDDGEATITKSLPSSNTEWVGNAVCLSEVEEVAFSPEARLSAFHAIFVSMSSTSVAKVGESVTLDILVSNFLLEGEGCMAVELSLGESENYSANSGSLTRTDCVCPQQTKLHQITITMSGTGSINVPILAEVIDSSTVCPADTFLTPNSAGIKINMTRFITVSS